MTRAADSSAESSSRPTTPATVTRSAAPQRSAAARTRAVCVSDARPTSRRGQSSPRRRSSPIASTALGTLERVEARDEQQRTAPARLRASRRPVRDVPGPSPVRGPADSPRRPRSSSPGPAPARRAAACGGCPRSRTARGWLRARNGAPLAGSTRRGTATSPPARETSAGSARRGQRAPDSAAAARCRVRTAHVDAVALQPRPQSQVLEEQSARPTAVVERERDHAHRAALGEQAGVVARRVDEHLVGRAGGSGVRPRAAARRGTSPRRRSPPARRTAR